MPTQLSWTDWFHWLHVLLWPAAAWGALRLMTDWGYRPLPIRRERLGVFAAWLALAGWAGDVPQLALNGLGTGLGLIRQLAEVSSPSSDESFRQVWFIQLSWALTTFILLGTALWFGSWLVHRIDWARVGGEEAPDPPTPPASGWRHLYLSMAVAAGILPLYTAAGMVLILLSLPTADLLEPTAVVATVVVLASIALAAWLARDLVDDLLSSGLMRSDQAPPTRGLRQGLWLGAMGLVTNGLWPIPSAILDIVDSMSWSYPEDAPTLDLILPRLSGWIHLAALIGLSILVFRLLPKPLAEWGPRHALRGFRRLTTAMALASTMAWPLEFLRPLTNALASWLVGLEVLRPLSDDPASWLAGSAARGIPAAIAAAVIIWLLTWRPKVRA
jgi:hypothetical protein